MHFEERELKPYAEPISESDLKEGGAYFIVNFIDNDMLIPAMVPNIYIGKNLVDGDDNIFYFQDIDSYYEGVRIKSMNDMNPELTASICTSKELKGIYEFEHALDVLMRCSLRRREKHLK